MKGQTQGAEAVFVLLVYAAQNLNATRKITAPRATINRVMGKLGVKKATNGSSTKPMRAEEVLTLTKNALGKRKASASQAVNQGHRARSQARHGNRYRSAHHAVRWHEEDQQGNTDQGCEAGDNHLAVFLVDH